jgi:hypothetical protein
MAKKDNFLKAQKEFDSGTKDTALWTQALALSNGDEDKAKYKYIELRAKEMGKFSFRIIEKEAGTNWLGLPIFVILFYTGMLFQEPDKQQLLGGAYWGEYLGYLLAYFFILYILVMFMSFFISFSKTKLPKKTAWKIISVLSVIFFWLFVIPMF